MNSSARFGLLGACILAALLVGALAILMSVGDAGAASNGPAPGKQTSPLEQTDPAVWTEGRSDGAGFNIWGARVSPDGVVLDPGGFPISTAAGAQTAPALAFDGTNFMVVWDDGRPGSSSSFRRSSRTPTS